MDFVAVPDASATPKRRWLTDEEIEEYCKAHGSTAAALTEKLVSAGKSTTVKGKKGKSYNSCRSQMSIKGRKFKVHNLRLWLTVRLAQLQPSFAWAQFAGDVLANCPDDELAGIKLKEFFDDMESVRLQDCLDGSFETLKKNVDAQESNRLANPPEDAEHEHQEEGASTTSRDRTRQYKGAPNCGENDIAKAIARAFLADPILAMGIDKSLVEEKFSDCTDRDLGLEPRKREMLIDFKNRSSTFEQYATMKNFFLLWLNIREPSMFSERGALLADEAAVYKFLTELQDVKICLTGTEPALCDVLEGRANYQLTPGDKPFSLAYGKKYLNALTELFGHQQTLLRFKSIRKLRENGMLKAWESNLRKSDRRHKEGASGDPQATVFQGDCPLEIKERQSTYLLGVDTPAATRNRALGLCQIFSISRFDEISRWRFSQMHMKTYSTRLPQVGKQPIIPVYFQQGLHKTADKKDSRIPDQRVLIRHREWRLCPQGALSYYLFDRLVLQGESPVDLRQPAGQWEDVYIFRSSTSRFKPLDQSTAYAQRKELFDITHTGLAGSVNHLDRKLGAWLAYLCGLTKEEVRSIGLWDSGEMDKHYLKYSSPDTCAKLSGFVSANQYDIPRARLSIDHFVSTSDGVDPAFFSCFMPFLDDPFIEQGVNDLLRQQINANRNIFMALRHLRTVFYQDLYFYYNFNKHMRIFSAKIFEVCKGTFDKWIEYCRAQLCDDGQACGQHGLDDTDDIGAEWSKRLVAVEKSTESLIVSSEIHNSKLDRLLHMSRPSILAEAPRIEEIVGKISRGDSYALKDFSIVPKLRQLKEMSMYDVVQEWTVGSVYQGVQMEPLSKFDQSRIAKECPYYKSIKSAVLLRRELYKFFRSNVLMEGTEKRAYEAIEDKRRKLGGKGKPCSLDFLYRSIRGHKRAKRCTTDASEDDVQ